MAFPARAENENPTVVKTQKVPVELHSSHLVATEGVKFRHQAHPILEVTVQIPPTLSYTVSMGTAEQTEVQEVPKEKESALQEWQAPTEGSDPKLPFP